MHIQKPTLRDYTRIGGKVDGCSDVWKNVVNRTCTAADLLKVQHLRVLRSEAALTIWQDVLRSLELKNEQPTADSSCHVKTEPSFLPLREAKPNNVQPPWPTPEIPTDVREHEM